MYVWNEAKQSNNAADGIFMIDQTNQYQNHLDNAASIYFSFALLVLEKNNLQKVVLNLPVIHSCSHVQRILNPFCIGL